MGAPLSLSGSIAGRLIGAAAGSVALFGGYLNLSGSIAGGLSGMASGRTILVGGHLNLSGSITGGLSGAATGSVFVVGDFLDISGSIIGGLVGMEEGSTEVYDPPEVLLTAALVEYRELPQIPFDDVSQLFSSQGMGKRLADYDPRRGQTGRPQSSTPQRPWGKGFGQSQQENGPLIGENSGQAQRLAQFLEGVRENMVTLESAVRFSSQSGGGANAGVIGQINDIINQINDIVRQINIVTDEINTVTGEINRVGGEINTVTGEINDITRQINDIVTQINAIGVQINTVTSEINDVAADVNTFTGQLNAIIAQINDIVDQINEVSAQISAIDGLPQIAQIIGRIDMLDVEVGMVTTQVGTIEGEIGLIETQVGTIDTQIGEIEGVIDTIQTNIGMVPAGANVFGQLGRLEALINQANFGITDAELFPWTVGILYDRRVDGSVLSSGGGTWLLERPNGTVIGDIGTGPIDWSFVASVVFNVRDANGLDVSRIFRNEVFAFTAGGVGPIPIGIRREQDDGSVDIVGFHTTGDPEELIADGGWRFPVGRTTAPPDEGTIANIRPGHIDLYNVRLVLPSLERDQFGLAGRPRRSEHFWALVSAEIVLNLQGITDSDPWPAGAVSAANSATDGRNRQGDIVTLYRGAFRTSRAWDPVTSTWVAFTAFFGGNLVGINGILADHIAADQIVGRHILAQAKLLPMHIAAAQILALHIGADQVQANHLQANSVALSSIQDGAVSEVKITPGAITVTKIADFAVTGDKLSVGAVSETKIEAGAITVTKIQDGAISSTKIEAGAITTDKIGVNQILAMHIATGQIIARHVLAGQITADKIAVGAITADKIAANAITAGKIRAGAVTVAAIGSGAVTEIKLANGAVTVTKLQDGAVSTTKIQGGAITTDKIAANQIIASHIATGQIIARHVLAGQITADKIAAGAITAGKIAANAITAINIAANAVTVTSIQNGAVTGNKLGNNAVTTTKIAGGAITTDKIGVNQILAMHIATGQIIARHVMAGQITADKIAAGAITAGKIAANAITAGKIAAGAVTVTAIGSGAVTEIKLANGAVTVTKIQDGAVSTTKIQGGAITTDKIGANQIIASQIATGQIIARHVLAGQITADKIAALAITADKIAALAITAGKIAVDAITADKIAADAILAQHIAANQVEARHISAVNIEAITGDFADLNVSGRLVAGSIDTNVQNYRELWRGDSGPSITNASAGDLLTISQDVNDFDALLVSVRADGIGGGVEGIGTISVRRLRLSYSSYGSSWLIVFGANAREFEAFVRIWRVDSTHVRIAARDSNIDLYSIAGLRNPVAGATGGIDPTPPDDGDPPTASFSASPTSISPGGSAVLTWSTGDADTVSINQGIGSVAASGTQSVSPSSTTTYTLTATNDDGSTAREVTVTVSQGLPNASSPNVTIAEVSSVDEDDTLSLSASVSGGTYDALAYLWEARLGGGDYGEGNAGSFSGSGANVTYNPPNVGSSTTVRVRCTVTATGNGNNAESGTSDTDEDIEDFTVLVVSDTTPDLSNFNPPNPAVGEFYSYTPPNPGGEAPLQWSLANARSWVSIDSSTGRLSGTPAASDAGFDSFTVSVEDDDGNTDSESVNFTVSQGLPNASAPNVTIAEVSSFNEGDPFTITASVSGGTYDGALEYVWSVDGGSGNGTISGSGSSVTYNSPDVTENIEVTVRVTVTARGTGGNAENGTSDTDTDTELFVVRFVPGLPTLPVASAPNVTIGPVASVDEDDTLTLNASTSGGTYDSLTYVWSVDGGSGNGTISGSGSSVTYNPPDVTSNSNVTVRCIVTAIGTGGVARNGTSDTDTDTEVFTVNVVAEPMSTSFAIQNVSVSSITSTNVFVRGTNHDIPSAYGSGAIVGVRLYFNGQVAIIGAGGGSLDAGVTANFRVRDSGNGDLSVNGSTALNELFSPSNSAAVTAFAQGLVNGENCTISIFLNT